MSGRRKRVILDSDDDSEGAIPKDVHAEGQSRADGSLRAARRGTTAAPVRIVVDLVGDDSDADMYDYSVPPVVKPRRSSAPVKAGARGTTLNGLKGVLTTSDAPSGRALSASSRSNKPIDIFTRTGFVPPVSRAADVKPQPLRGIETSSVSFTLAGHKRTIDASSAPPVLPADTRPWTDAYAPTSVDELALHAKKIQDIAAWLSRAAGGDATARLLVLMGPPGIGKSTAVELLASEAGMPVHRWVDDGTRRTAAGADSGDAVDHDDETGGWNDRRSRATAAIRDFSAFVLQASLFPALQLSGGAAVEASRPDRAPHLIVIEDMPRSLTGEHDALLQQMVQDVFRRMLHTSAFPVVLVLSEGEAVGDAPTKPALNRMLGADVMQHAGVTVMNIPPTPPTRMRKAVQRVVALHAKATRTAALSTSVCESIMRVQKRTCGMPS